MAANLDRLDVGYRQARNYTRGRLRKVQLIVVHSMESQEKGDTAESVAAYFATTEKKASAHYCIDSNSIVQCVRLEDTAWHCKNANANGIGLEHAGRARQTRAEWLDTYSEPMLDMSARLAARLCYQFDIPAQRAEFAGPNNPQVVRPGICGHRDVPEHGTHTDPGDSFPWDFYLARVQYHLIPMTKPRPEIIADDLPAPTPADGAPAALEVRQQNIEGAMQIVSTPDDPPITILGNNATKMANSVGAVAGGGGILAMLLQHQALAIVMVICATVIILAVFLGKKAEKLLTGYLMSRPDRYNIAFTKSEKPQN